MKKFGLIYLLVLFVAFGSCGQAKNFDEMVDDLVEGSVPMAKPDSCPANALYLDAREKAEYDVSHIPGALFVGYDHFDIHVLDSIPKNREMVVYCSVGYRSEKIGEKLIAAGYVNVTNLYGGIFLWVNEEREIVNAGGPTKQVHAYNYLWGDWLEKGEKVYK
jgi:rhodanese-related sulfurtransferase